VFTVRYELNLYIYYLEESRRVPGYRSRDPGSIPGVTRFSEK
jgi:hypothetical protein